MDKITRILIVDGDPNLLQIHSRLLKSVGYQVVEAGMGQDGLRLAKETRPDLILLDVVLPDIDGITVCRRIKADPALTGSFVILFSGLRTASEDQAGGLEAGADGYIARPISNREFLARVQALLRIKRTEDALRESEVRFRELFSNMSSGVVVYEVKDGGRDIRIRDINAAGEWISRVRREDVVGKSILEVFPGVREFGLLHVLQRVWRTGEPERLPAAQYRDDRLTFWAENYVYKLPSGEVVAVYDDVTEPRQAEEMIRGLARFPSENPNPVLRVAGDGTVLYANEAAGPLLRVWECQVGQSLPESWRAFAQDILSSGLSEDTEVDCEDHVFSLTFASVVDADYVNIYGLDITDRKRVEAALKEYSERLEEMVDERTQDLQKAQEQLVRREKLAVLGQLAGGVGHELRNPLGVISNAVYFLQMTLSDADETTREYLDMIFFEVRNAERIVSDLLDFARTRSPARERVAVSDLVSQTLEKYPPSENVRVTAEIAPSLPRVLVDPRQMEQVLINLVTNAYQAMSRGGHLTIRAYASEETVNLSIADTGCGIPQENLEQVFEPLFTTKTRGIGLGLAVSKSLVEANGGSIAVESEVGKGTNFTVRLPLSEGRTDG